ncbi:hypothetical protein OEW28_01085 [Defluviimonas sp. WL0002]|uniref:Glycosyltransferase n=1 Tax=Albidovulum marisflavi TaxID=2984159 RepID=A0ABT2Z871_9RHOB|nr:hypothetical protein [Defluviimonas sp. WL0002]MCV2867220.1 hypothetical protein [Defluviimonas sp. WL0002]
MTDLQPPVHSFYRSNISDRMLRAQSAVFDHLGISLNQCLDDTISHSDWLNGVFEGAAADDIVVVADIDAFPLRRDAFDQLVDAARDGAVAGLAQVANHKDPDKIYAGPMFMAVRASVWRNLGRPSMHRSETADVAQGLTDAALAAGHPIHLVYPRFAIQPKWPLAGRGVFGIGTFYGELEFFHLFQSRLDASLRLFEAVARDTVAGRFDFAEYIEIMSSQAAPQKRKRRFGLF